MPEEEVRRRLAAILSADVKGYSRLMQKNEVATIRRLNSCRELFTVLIRQHHGRVVDMPGDNILAEFASIIDGVQAAVAIQKELSANNAKLPKEQRMEFRIGINLGDIVAEDDRIYGDGVNMAAMLEALADPGGICISRTAYDQIETKLPLGYEYIGERAAKTGSKPIQAYKIIVDPADIRLWFKKWRKDRIRPGMPVPDGAAASDVSEKKRLPAALFCLAFGIFGAHRFYAGKSRSAKAMLYTLGGFGIWYVIDNVIVLFGEFTDDAGKKIKHWV